MSELPWVPERSMRFCRSRHAGIADLFSEAATPSSWLRSEERSKLSLRRACLPCGSGFPQKLLTCRRPVFPPRPGAIAFGTGFGCARCAGSMLHTCFDLQAQYIG